jgi:hypothetical protein
MTDRNFDLDHTRDLTVPPTAILQTSDLQLSRASLSWANSNACLVARLLPTPHSFRYHSFTGDGERAARRARQECWTDSSWETSRR